MSADDLGSIWTSEPLRISQSIKHAGKELDRDKTRQEEKREMPEREQDSVELSSENESQEESQVIVHENTSEDDVLIPGKNLDITIGSL